MGVMAETATWTASEAGYANQEAVSNVTVNSNISLTFDKGTNSNAPKYYNTGAAVRCYGSNTITVNATSATITGITFTFASGEGTNAITANVGSFTSANWSGSASSVAFTIGGTTGHRRIAAIEVTYTTSGGSTPGKSTPTITATYKTSMVVGDAADVYAVNYTGDGALSVTSSNTAVATATLAAGNVTVTPVAAGTTTITISATETENYTSASKSYNLNVLAPLTTMDAIFAAATAAGSTATDAIVTFNNWVVSGVKNNNAYVTDNAGKGLVVYQSGHGFVVGDILSGTVACKVQLYRGSAQLNTITSTTEGLTVTAGGTITPVTTIALASLSGVNTGAVVSYENLEYDGTNFTDGVTNLKPYNTFITLPNLISGKNYNVTGMYLQYDATKEIAPRSAEDFELVEIINNYTVTFDVTENGTIVVKNGETVINNGDEVAEGTVLTIECTPANEDYRFRNWQYKAGEASWATRTSDFTYIMPSANVQFRANFELIPVYTVAWSVNGAIVKTDDLKEGAAVTAPAVEDIHGKVFAGWVTTENVAVDETPAYVTPSATATADVTYYAVFAILTPGDYTTTTDVLTRATTGVNDGASAYSDWSNKSADGGSTAIYAGNSAGSNNSIQLRSNNNNSGIITTTSGGRVKKVSVVWNSNTLDDRTLDIYGSNSVYATPADLYNISTAGVKLGSITKGTSTELNIVGDYTYLGIRSNSSAMYISSISIDWENGTPDVYSDFSTTVAEHLPAHGTLNFVATNEEGYWATFSSSENVIFDANDVVVYTAAVDGDALVLLDANNNSLSCVTDKTKDAGWVAGYYVQANTGVLVYSLENSVNYYYSEANGSNILNNIETDPEYNMLKAASVAMAGDFKFYKLAYDNYDTQSGLGFYYGAAEGAAFTAKAGGAYLAVPTSAGASIRYIINGEQTATAVENIEANENVLKMVENGQVIIIKNGVRYNALGQMLK